MFCRIELSNSHGSWDAYETTPRTVMPPPETGNSRRTACINELCDDNVSLLLSSPVPEGFPSRAERGPPGGGNANVRGRTYFSRSDGANDRHQLTGRHGHVDVVQRVFRLVARPFGGHVRDGYAAATVVRGAARGPRAVFVARQKTLKTRNGEYSSRRSVPRFYAPVPVRVSPIWTSRPPAKRPTGRTPSSTISICRSTK